jgi:hypothetical protein
MLPLFWSHKDAVCSPAAFEITYQTARCHNSEDYNVKVISRLCKNTLSASAFKLAPARPRGLADCAFMYSAVTSDCSVFHAERMCKHSALLKWKQSTGVYKHLSWTGKKLRRSFIWKIRCAPYLFIYLFIYLCWTEFYMIWQIITGINHISHATV